MWRRNSHPLLGDCCLKIGSMFFDSVIFNLNFFGISTMTKISLRIKTLVLTGILVVSSAAQAGPVGYRGTCTAAFTPPVKVAPIPLPPVPAVATAVATATVGVAVAYTFVTSVALTVAPTP